MQTTKPSSETWLDRQNKRIKPAVNSRRAPTTNSRFINLPPAPARPHAVPRYERAEPGSLDRVVDSIVTPTPWGGGI